MDIATQDQGAPSRAIEFARRYPDAAICTLRASGAVHTARIELSVSDGRIRTTGAPGLVRVRNLRRDPRCSLFVFGPHPLWLGLEARARFLEGPDAPELLIALQRARHGDTAPPDGVLAHDDELGHDRLYTEVEYQRRALQTGLLVVDFDVTRVYGNDDSVPPNQ